MRVEARPAEHELVAAHGAAARRHVDHLRPMPASEQEELLGLRDLEGIAAEPVNQS
jgi:hypothetical protein